MCLLFDLLILTGHRHSDRHRNLHPMQNHGPSSSTVSCIETNHGVKMASQPRIGVDYAWKSSELRSKSTGSFDHSLGTPVLEELASNDETILINHGSCAPAGNARTTAYPIPY